MVILFKTLTNYDSPFAGLVMARRGDLIRCTRIKEDLDTGEVSFRFTLNGRKITLEDSEVEIFTLSNNKGPLYPYVAMADGCSVLARVSIYSLLMITSAHCKLTVPRFQ